MFDINVIRGPILDMNDLPNVDAAYAMHYDETNNIRRLHLTPDGLNVRTPQCFVLGGVAHKGIAPPLSFEDLRVTFGLQKSALEMKLDHLGKGDFLAMLRSEKIAAFLAWLSDQSLFVHYQVLDPLYWSIVDIIDSILDEKAEVQLFMLAPQLKNDLYEVLRSNEETTSEFLHRYDYPDVGAVRRVAFIEELLELLEARRALLAPFNYQMLKGVIQYGRKLDRLPYLERETPKVLIDRFGDFYLNRIALFKTATHILDIEKQIEAFLIKQDIRDGQLPVSNFSFVDSKQHAWIQVSDALVGLLGKMFSYLNKHSLKEIMAARSALDGRQMKSLQLINDLIDRSDEECPAFIQHVISLEDQRRGGLFLDG